MQDDRSHATTSDNSNSSLESSIRLLNVHKQIESCCRRLLTAWQCRIPLRAAAFEAINRRTFRLLGVHNLRSQQSVEKQTTPRVYVQLMPLILLHFTCLTSCSCLHCYPKQELVLKSYEWKHQSRQVCPTQNLGGIQLQACYYSHHNFAHEQPLCYPPKEHARWCPEEHCGD